MRDHLLCSKLKLDKKTDENECLTNELTSMKKRCDRLEQENQKFKLQIDFERKKVELGFLCLLIALGYFLSTKE